jgi:hypothetical protein
MNHIALTQPQDYPQKNYPQKNRVLYRLLDKFYHTKLKWNKARRERLLAFEPEIANGLEKFYEKTGKKKADYYLRLTEILETLEKTEPKYIYEMGSGRSSMIFASWAKKRGIDFIALEQLDFWQELTNEILAPISSGNNHLKSSDIIEIENFGGRYKENIPLEADFIYVDGPTIVVTNNTTTYLRKSCYTDVADYIRRGGKPKVIMVEGRTESVDLIISEAEKAGLRFKLLPGFHWAIQRNLYLDALSARHHSILLFC